MPRERMNFATPTPTFARKSSTWSPPSQVEGAYPKNCMVELPRTQVSEVHFDEFPDPPTFQCWKTKFKVELWSCSGCPTDAMMLWIKEEEMAKSVGDLLTSQSIRGYKFSNFEMRDAKIASALKRIGSSLISASRGASAKQKRVFFEEDIADQEVEMDHVPMCVWQGCIKGEHTVATEHGHNITIGGERSALEVLIKMISSQYEIKKQVIGEDADLEKIGRILNRGHQVGSPRHNDRGGSETCQ